MERSASVYLFGNASQPDLNGIPLSAIERIEVCLERKPIYGVPPWAE